MAMDPAKLSFVRWTDFIPVTAFSGLGDAPTITILGGAAGTAIGIVTDADGAALTKAAATARTGIVGVQPPRSSGIGNPVLQEVSTNGIMGLLMDTAGDTVNHFMRIPNKWDRKHPIYFRVAWVTTSSTSADTVDWKVFYLAFIPNTTTLGVPATALDTVIPQDTVGSSTARRLRLTEKGTMNARTILNTQKYIQLSVEMDAKAGGLSEDLWLLGLEIEYTPRLGKYHRRVEGEPWAATSNPS